MSAAIFEHNLSAGAGYSWSRCSVDLAYQWDIPKTRKVGTSGIRAGEFSNSATSTGIHWIGLTFGMTFK